MNPDQAVLEIKQGNADYLGDGTPPAQNVELGATLGPDSPVSGPTSNSSSPNPILAISYLAMNTSRPNFDNELVRQAVNFAIDRQAILDQSGKYGGEVTDQILPTRRAGSRGRADLPAGRARPRPGSGADGSIGCGHPVRGRALHLRHLSLPRAVAGDPGEPEGDRHRGHHQRFDRNIQFQKEGVRDEPFDLADEGWFADYADPYDFINVLLDGTRIQATNNSNFSYFRRARVETQRMIDASRLSGDERYRTYGQLDIDISSGPAPWADVGDPDEQTCSRRRSAVSPSNRSMAWTSTSCT